MNAPGRYCTDGHPGGRQRAFSLVELLVAMILGLLLIGAAASLFLSTRQLYQEQERVAVLKETLRFTTDFMTRDIRGAGLRQDGALDLPAGLQPTDADAIAQGRFIVRKAGMNCLGDLGPWVASVYSVEQGQLYCGNEAVPPQKQPLVSDVRAMAAVALDAAGQPDWAHPVALRIELVLESHAGSAVLLHNLEFVVTLRNAVLEHYQAIGGI
jgi:type IV pilus assembly protein PilW